MYVLSCSVNISYMIYVWHMNSFKSMTNKCLYACGIIKTKPSYPWNSEKAITFWFLKFLTATSIPHPKHIFPKNSNSIQEQQFHAGMFPNNVLPNQERFRKKKVKHFHTSIYFQWIHLIHLGFPGVIRHHCGIIGARPTSLGTSILQGTVLKKVLQSSGIIQPLGSQLRSFAWPYSCTYSVGQQKSLGTATSFV